MLDIAALHMVSWATGKFRLDSPHLIQKQLTSFVHDGPTDLFSDHHIRGYAMVQAILMSSLTAQVIFSSAMPCSCPGCRYAMTQNSGASKSRSNVTLAHIAQTQSHTFKNTADVLHLLL